eukprot:COSAG01_NODE_21478_length_900_cov_1.339576_2_plen_105_part_01
MHAWARARGVSELPRHRASEHAGPAPAGCRATIPPRSQSCVAHRLRWGRPGAAELAPNPELLGSQARVGGVAWGHREHVLLLQHIRRQEELSAWLGLHLHRTIAA